MMMLLGTDKWDRRFLEQAFQMASWSKDPSTKVGCVIVDHDGIQVAMGYNGFPRNVIDSEERYADRPKKYKYVVHAEANAIAAAARKGHSLYQSAIYCTHHPCANCAGLIIQAGIGLVVYNPSKELEARWYEDIAIAENMFYEANVSIRAVDIQSQPSSCRSHHPDGAEAIKAGPSR
jgi:dCMP deaminase